MRGMVRSEPGRRRFRGVRGYTLVETMVAMLLVAMVVTSVFSMVLTARMGTAKTGRRAQALLHVRRAMERMKAYVTADTSVTAAPTPNWVFPSDTCGCWALQSGDHDISAYLPASFQSAPINGKLTYRVTDVACGPAVCKQVAFSISWDE